MGIFAVLAETFRYPAKVSVQTLQEEIQSLPEGAVKAHLECFMIRLNRLGRDEWEKLYTSTLDLNPVSPPYVGYMIWGDHYARGEFLARLNRDMRAAGVDLDGELPDHLVPVLRYLERVAEPIAELESVLAPALQGMLLSLAKIDAENLYLEPLAATLEAAGSWQPVGRKEFPDVLE